MNDLLCSKEIVSSLNVLTIGNVRSNSYDFKEKLDAVLNERKYTKVLIVISTLEILKCKDQIHIYLERLNKYFNQYDNITKITRECVFYNNGNVLNSFIQNFLNENNSFIENIEEDNTLIIVLHKHKSMEEQFRYFNVNVSYSYYEFDKDIHENNLKITSIEKDLTSLTTINMCNKKIYDTIAIPGELLE